LEQNQQQRFGSVAEEVAVCLRKEEAEVAKTMKTFLQIAQGIMKDVVN